MTKPNATFQTAPAREKWPAVIKVGSVVVKVYRVPRATVKAPKRKRSGPSRKFDYVLAWHTPEGRQRRKFALPSTALDEGRLKAEQLAAGRIEAMGMNRSDRDELDALRELAGKTPPMAAMKEWKRADQLTGGEIIAACEAWADRKKSAHELITVAECVKRYLAAKTKAGIGTAKNHASIFKDLTSEFGGRMLHEITTRQLDVWLAQRATKGTRQTYRKWVVAMWRWAQKQHYLDRTRLTEAEHTEPVKPDDMVVGIIDAEIFGRLLAHFYRKHIEYLPALVLAGFGGLRRSEIHAQRWEDINLTAGHLRVTKGKRGTPSRRLVPLCPAAVEWLLLVADRTEWICSNLSVDRIRHIARDAKYELPENCFRHAFITHRVAQTGNIAETSLVAGNSPAVIRKHYLELVTKEVGELWFNLNPAAVAKIEAGGEVVPMPTTSAGKAGVA